MDPNMNQEVIKRIIEKYISGNASADEIKFIESYYNYLDKNEEVLSALNEDDFKKLKENGLKAINEQILLQDRKRTKLPLRLAAAAAVLVLVIGGFVFFKLREQKATDHIVFENNKFDVLPGTEKAVLTLSNGHKVVLDNKSDNKIIDQNGLNVVKTNQGELIYTLTDKAQSSEKEQFNTVETPRGGQFQILLPDGTKVWLNASSSIKYPQIFKKNERRVKLVGEAYFEVAKDAQKPFFVENEMQSVEVLGTHFNVNSYPDDQIVKTTLLEGSVKVRNAYDAIVYLKPGEQAIAGNKEIKVVKDIEVEDEVAWKNGQFRFNNANLTSILKQLERWYNIKIDYKSIPNRRFNGMVSRKSNLSQVLGMLERTGSLKFIIEENGNVRATENKN